MLHFCSVAAMFGRFWSLLNFLPVLKCLLYIMCLTLLKVLSSCIDRVFESKIVGN